MGNANDGGYVKLPTRVLDVGMAEDVGCVNVVSSRSIGSLERPCYATLSYPWGGDQNIKTTIATLHAHIAGIKMSDLGKLYRMQSKFLAPSGLGSYGLTAFALFKTVLKTSRRRFLK
jgi:hypothetical protein